MQKRQIFTLQCFRGGRLLLFLKRFAKVDHFENHKTYHETITILPLHLLSAMNGGKKSGSGQSQEEQSCPSLTSIPSHMSFSIQLRSTQ